MHAPVQPTRRELSRLIRGAMPDVGRIDDSAMQNYIDRAGIRNVFALACRSDAEARNIAERVTATMKGEPLPIGEFYAACINCQNGVAPALLIGNDNQMVRIVADSSVNPTGFVFDRTMLFGDRPVEVVPGELKLYMFGQPHDEIRTIKSA